MSLLELAVRELALMIAGSDMDAGALAAATELAARAEGLRSTAGVSA